MDSDRFVGRTPRVLFGGTFDPPHRAHWALAEAAAASVAQASGQPLSRVVVHWVPAGDPWQKTSGPNARVISPPEHRAAMVEQALADGLRARPPSGAAVAETAQHRLDRIEVDRHGPSYTVDTLTALRQAHPEADWWLLLGADQVSRLPTWHRWTELLALTGLAVAARNGTPPPPLPALAPGQPPPKLLQVPLPPMDVSSTEVRARAARGDPIEGLVSGGVARYIAQQGLYRAGRPA